MTLERKLKLALALSIMLCGTFLIMRGLKQLFGEAGIDILIGIGAIFMAVQILGKRNS